MSELLWEGNPLSNYSRDEIITFHDFMKDQINNAISQENKVNSLLRKNAYTTDLRIMLFYRKGLDDIENYLSKVE